MKPTRKRQREIYQKGKRAGRWGFLPKDNPCADPILHKAWKEGCLNALKGQQ